jgi:hypothetical protein
MEAQKRAAVERMRGQGEPNTFNSPAIFRELFEPREDCGPVWYTEEMHERASAALRQCPY